MEPDWSLAALRPRLQTRSSVSLSLRVSSLRRGLLLVSLLPIVFFIYYEAKSRGGGEKVGIRWLDRSMFSVRYRESMWHRRCLAGPSDHTAHRSSPSLPLPPRTAALLPGELDPVSPYLSSLSLSLSRARVARRGMLPRVTRVCVRLFSTCASSLRTRFVSGRPSRSSSASSSSRFFPSRDERGKGV